MIASNNRDKDPGCEAVRVLGFLRGYHLVLRKEDIVIHYGPVL